MKNLLQTLIKNYMNDLEGIIGVSICDREGLIIASDSRGGTDDIIMGAMSAIIDSYIDRIKNEFGSQGNFCNITNTENKKFAYCSQGPQAIITTIASPDTSDVALRVYSEHIATKIELILTRNENVSLEIPEVVKILSKTRGGMLPKGEFSTKLIVTGIFQVGKTSLIKRFVENRFQESYISTIGVEISKKTITPGDDTKVSFILWDVGGQMQQMAPYRARFYGGANAAFIVIDRTRAETLDSVKTWYDDIKKSVPADIPIVIVANKSDVENLYISEEDIKKKAEEYGFHYILTSAKTGENVNDAFLYCAFKFLERI